MNEKEIAIKILPPPLKWPLQPQQACDVLWISKTSLLRWEKEGLISEIPRTIKGVREVESDQLLGLMEAMQTMVVPYNPDLPRHPWLASIDLDERPLSLETPSGYTLVFE